MLKDIVREYPYFSSANLLLAKAMSNDKHYEYEKQLKSTALTIGDRSVLYKIINSIPLESVDEPHVIAEIPTALRVEKISKPDFIGVEEELPVIDAPLIEDNSKQFEEKQIHETPFDSFSHLENIVDESLNTIVDVRHEIIANFEETPIEKVESKVEPETNHLTQWNSFDQPIEIEENEELNEVDLALDEELRNEARSIIEDAKQHDLVMDLAENFDLIPEDSLAESTGNMLRFENIRDENSLINLDDDDILMDFDFGSLEGEKENSSFNQIANTPVFVESNKIKIPEPEISNPIEDKVEFKTPIEKVEEETTDPFIAEKEVIEKQSIVPNLDLIIEEEAITELSEEQAEIDILPDPFASPEEDKLDSNTHEIFAPSLENLLDFDEVVETKEAIIEEPLSNWTEENMANFKQAFEEYEVSEIEQEIIDYKEEFEPIEEIKIENQSWSENDIDENEVIVEEPIHEIPSNNEENYEEHGFMDWLVAKKESEISSESNIDSAEKINDFTNEEEDEFILTIRQLIKERAEKSSDHKNEFTQDVEQINNSSIGNIEETTVESINDLPNNEVQEDITIVEEKSEEAHPFYDYKVESVLPDFEQMVFHDVSDEETNENASELHIEPSFEEKLITEEVKLVFHPIHGLVPAGFDDDATQNSIEKKTEPVSEEPIIEPWAEFNESLIVPTVETEIASNPFIHEDELLGRLGEIPIDSITDSSEEEEEEIELPVFDEVSFSDADFDKGFSSQFVPLTKADEHTEMNVSEPELTVVKEAKTVVKINDEPKVVVKDEKVESIIDKFIRENPNISRPKSEFYNPSNMAKWSAEEDDDLVSETLANVYLGQGLIKKAISTYEKLGLIYPHKMSYFAALINQLKTTHKIE